MKDLKILVIDRESAGPNEIEGRLKTMGYVRTRTIAPDKSLLELESLSPDVAIMGSSLSNEQCYESIRKLKIVDILAPVLVLPGSDGRPEEDFPAGFHGIFHFTLDADTLEISNRIQESLKSRSDCAAIPDLPVLIGTTPEIHMIRERIRMVSDKDVTVLIEGETGTGKEIVAQSIHYFSLRRKGPMIKISCGNLPDQLLESEVFGYQKGAYFLRKYCSLLKKEPVELPANTLERFDSYHWPGNVRELENLVKRAIVLRNWDFVEQEILSGENRMGGGYGSPSPDPGCTPDLGQVARHLAEENPSLREITRAYVSEIERKAILDALDAVRWNRKRAARLLGISYKTVCNRIKDLGIGVV